MRVSLARALVTDPDILLMDEPFAALDEITRFRLNNDLLSLWRNLRKTVIFVTHSVFESVYLSQRVVVMTARPGRIGAEISDRRGRAARRGFPDLRRLCRAIAAGFRTRWRRLIGRSRCEHGTLMSALPPPPACGREPRARLLRVLLPVLVLAAGTVAIWAAGGADQRYSALCTARAGRGVADAGQRLAGAVAIAADHAC